MEEIWKPVPGEPKYFASSLGRVRGPRGLVAGTKNAAGYLTSFRRVGFNQAKQYRLHRFVAAAFLDEDPDRLYVNHKNGNKTDNRPENLEWCTLAENSSHSMQILGNKSKVGSPHRGEQTPNSILTEEQVRTIRQMHAEGLTGKAIADLFDYKPATVRAVITRTTWAHVL